jgi:hypothetical protein
MDTFLTRKQNLTFMKRLLVLVITLSAICFSTYSQVSLGIKGGLNLSNITGDDIDDADMRASIHLGGYLNFAFSEKLSLQPELLYNSMGAKDNPDPDLDYTLKLSYITIPVNLMYSIRNFNIHAGPQLGFLVAAKEKYEAGGDSQENDIKDELKGADFGFGLGVGANFGKLNATIRYVAGLSSIVDEGDIDVKNSLIQLSLGYRIFGGND